jgi:1-acyl-sn-glycerol-3-phosphate acyltransferase
MTALSASSESTSASDPAPAGTPNAGQTLPGSDRTYRVFIGVTRRLVRHLWSVEVNGLEHVPSSGGAILAPNHLAFCDSVFLPAVLDRRVWFVGKAEYMDDWKTKHLFPAFGMIPVDRSGGENAMAALDTAAKVIEAGHLFGIYPEGTRSRDRQLHKGRTGAARLAIRCGVPIIPVGIKGTPDIQPPGSVVPRPFKSATISFGAPMWGSDFGRAGDPRTLRSFTDALMFEIAQLSGQSYVHEYAGSESAAPAVTAKPPAGAPPLNLTPESAPRDLSVVRLGTD